MIKLTIKETVGDVTKEKVIELDNIVTLNNGSDINKNEFNDFLKNILLISE
jgi:hypothetical protein